MSTELNLDTQTAKSLARAGKRMKPKRAVVRAYKVDQAFWIAGDQQREAGDYIVEMPDGSVESHSAKYIEDHFEPVAKRISRPKLVAE